MYSQSDISLSLLTVIFSRWTRVSRCLLKQRMMESDGDNWSYKSCKAPVKSSPPTNQHPTFYRPDALPVTQPTVSNHWREKYYIPWTCLYPKLTWGSTKKTLSLTTNSSWLPWWGLRWLLSALLCSVENKTKFVRPRPLLTRPRPSK